MSSNPLVDVRWVHEHVAELVWSRPPANYFDPELLAALAGTVEAMDADPACRVVILASEGKHFCAGSNLAGRDRSSDKSATQQVYAAALRLFKTAKPMIAAVQGSAIGGGLGLAVAADFRVVADNARLTANFSRLGYFPGFALTHTLPRLIGAQHAARMFYTGLPVSAGEALTIGLADRVVPLAQLREAAQAFAVEIAGAAPQSVAALRRHLRGDLHEKAAAAIEFEATEQMPLRALGDFAEGVRASAERRPPVFTGK